MIEFSDWLERKMPKKYKKYPFLVWLLIVLCIIIIMVTLQFIPHKYGIK
jgi:hypothetical protein